MTDEEIAALPDGAVLRAPNGDALTMDRYMPTTPVLRISDGSYVYLHNVHLEYELADLRRES